MLNRIVQNFRKCVANNRQRILLHRGCKVQHDFHFVEYRVFLEPGQFQGPCLTGRTNCIIGRTDEVVPCSPSLANLANSTFFREYTESAVDRLS